MNRHSIASLFLAVITSAIVLTSCKKDDHISNDGHQPHSYSSEVLDKWMTMQLRLMRNTTGVPNQAFSRHYVYSGIAALQSLSPGMHGQANWSSRWNGLSGLPIEAASVNYYFPANVNAALAAINRLFFPNASVADKAAIDSLETTLQQGFLATEPQSIITRSTEFGKAVAAAVFNWSETDGYKNASNAYTPPTGPGMWVPTPPANAAPSTPYWGNNRPVIAGSISNTLPVAPPSYSAEVGSPFYNMVKEVYDASQNLTVDQKEMAIFWRDVPGVTSPGHWLSILQQVIHKKQSRLDKAAFAYALTGAAMNDAFISCWKAKYQFNLVRPITYIRNIMGHSGWNTQIGTPPHPEYPSAHASLSAATAEAFERVFGPAGAFTDRTYDYMGLAPRTYSSYTAIGQEAGQSRLYAGIHYQPSIDAGLILGRKVADNIFSPGGGSNSYYNTK